MAEGCDCKLLSLRCLHEDGHEFDESNRNVSRGQQLEVVNAKPETVTDSEEIKQSKCEANGAERVDNKDSNLAKANTRSCPDLVDQSGAIRLTFGRLTKKLGRRKSWKFFRSSQESDSVSENKKQETRKRKESKKRKSDKEISGNERQTSTSTSTSACGGVSGLFRLRSQSTETKVTRTRRSRAQRTSVIDKVFKLFDSESNERENDGDLVESTQPRQSTQCSTEDLGENVPSSLEPRHRFPPTDQEHFAFIEKVVREDNLHFFDEETQRLWRERTSMECFLPRDILSVTNCPYYWGAINRYQAEKILENHPDGMYLLRDSAQYHYLYSVSFRRYKRTYHARIEQWRHRYSFDKPSEYSYYSRSVCELLQHYSRAQHCMFYEPMLIKPLPRKRALPLQALCRAAVCSCITFDGVDQLPLPKSLKNYLREYHYKVPVKRTSDKGTQTQNVPKNWRTLSGSWWS